VKPAMADAFDDSPVVIAELPHIKLFGKWSSEDVNHSDMSLAVSYYNTSVAQLIFGLLLQTVLRVDLLIIL